MRVQEEKEMCLRSLRRLFDHSQYVYTVEKDSEAIKFLSPGCCECGGETTSYIANLTYDIAVATDNEMRMGGMTIKDHTSPQALLNDLARTLHPDKDIQLWETRL